MIGSQTAQTAAEPEKVKRLLESAERCRQLARGTPDADLAADNVQLAEKYERVAAEPFGKDQLTLNWLAPYGRRQRLS